jgi:hypothetical protein
VQKEFDDSRAFVMKHGLKTVDMIVSGFPLLLRRQTLDAHHEYIFVVRTIEYRDFAKSRHILVNAP